MERHITLLATLTNIWGALVMLVGVSMLLLATGAMVELYAPAGSAVGLAASLTAVMFVAVGVFALLWGGAHVWAALLLRRRQPGGRVLTLALAVTNLPVLPFGTALGSYALWALLTNDGRRLFHGGPREPEPPGTFPHEHLETRPNA